LPGWTGRQTRTVYVRLTIVVCWRGTARGAGRVHARALSVLDAHRVFLPIVWIIGDELTADGARVSETTSPPVGGRWGAPVGGGRLATAGMAVDRPPIAGGVGNATRTPSEIQRVALDLFCADGTVAPPASIPSAAVRAQTNVLGEVDGLAGALYANRGLSALRQGLCHRLPCLFSVGTCLNRIANATRAIAAVAKHGLAVSVRTDEMLGALKDRFHDTPVIVILTPLHSTVAHAAGPIGATAR
jgi:hypothetical protein